jgi:hypothetical protein
MNDEPNLDEPGAPDIEDHGGDVFHEHPQTKRDNCVRLAELAGGEEHVTREMVEAHPVLTWRDYCYWILELVEEQKRDDFTWDMIQRYVGPLDLPESRLDRLGLRHVEPDNTA